MEYYVMEFKVKSTAWGGCNFWKNNKVEFFDLTGSVAAAGSSRGRSLRDTRHCVTLRT
jgi:hypothetical protein